ncbi:AGE family epimerase/isomerase [Flavimaricola marinus]|uniref:Putative sugar isomerase YihS n=1 Tax=Flavimaricola marinus TaxID=1819565 RepID=A0A238L9M3_9RHOB|nr:AGE family epimerase/isomerase [Flavimaricola marinus]SMY06301.1 putative sugar isomerase YihS [Flavimaricola marinus]
MTQTPISDPAHTDLWLRDPVHRQWLLEEARHQLSFFDGSLRDDGGFDLLDWDGSVLPRDGQELHTSTRMVHSYALGKIIGHPGSDRMIDAGMDYIWNMHRDTEHGGYLWSIDETGIKTDTKLAYGHVFVLLAASSAKKAGHPDADRLFDDITEVLDRHFWDETAGLLRDEFSRDFTPFSTYRGLNANMHGVEGFLAAFEATGDAVWLDRAGRILDFFTDRIASAHDWRIPEHYTEDWQVDPDYEGNPIFRPAGTTPGHSLEIARLALQHWDLSGRPDTTAPERARKLIEQALTDAWLPDGGLAYTLHPGGDIDKPGCYFWPVAEAIAAIASLQKTGGTMTDESWYRRLWTFANERLIDHERGGWYPEVAPDGQPMAEQFPGKPDIYHSLQATLYPLATGISRQGDDGFPAGA